MTASTSRKVLVDHAFTNFWHAASEVFGYNDFMQYPRCVGNHYSHYFQLEYLKQYIRNYEGHNRFAYVHCSKSHESTGTIIKIVDNDLKQFINETLDYYSKIDEDVMIMILGDHGKHVEPYDTYPEGNTENQLPFHYLIANKDLLVRMGDSTDSIIKHNTKRLVSRLDWHMTLKHLSTVPYGNLSPKSELYKTWKSMTDSNKSISLLLEEVPDERTCDDVTIPIHRCSCNTWLQLNTEHANTLDFLKILASLGMYAINNRLRKEHSLDFCKILSFKNIIQAESTDLEESQTALLFRIRATVNEDPVAHFEIQGIFSTAEKIKKWLKNDEDGEIYPIANVTINHEPMMMQVLEIIRVDSYTGICEEIAGSIGAKPGYCICNRPERFNYTENISESKERVLSSLKKKLTIYLGNNNEICFNVCKDRDMICKE